MKEMTKCKDLIRDGMLLSIDSGKYKNDYQNNIYGSSSSGELFHAKVNLILIQ